MTSSKAALPVANIEESYLVENTKLRTLNEELTSQNNLLRKQIDDSLQISDKTEAVFNENKTLKSKLTQFASEKEDLQKRLQITIQQMEDLQRHVNNQNIKSDEQNSAIQKAENEYKSQIQNLEKQLNLEKIKNDQTQKEKTKIEKDIELIFEHASTFFDDKIQIVTDLIPHFQKPNDHSSVISLTQSIQSDKNDTSVNFEKSQIDISKYKKKINKLKTALKTEIKKNEDLQDQHNSSIKKLENQHELKIIEITSEIHKITNQLDQQKRINEEISKKNNLLNTENARLDSQLQLSKIKTVDTDSEKVIQMSHHISDLNEKIHDLQEINNELKNEKIPELASKNRTLKMKISSLTEKFNNLQEQYNDESNKSSIQIERFEIRSKDLLDRIASKDKEIMRLKIDIEKVKTQSSELSGDLINERSENDSLRNENSKITLLLNQQKSMNQQLEYQVNQFSQKVAALTTELDTTKTKLNIANQPTDISKLIPLACWSVPELPDDLNSIVESIVKNATLELPSKLRHVISVICQWFKGKNERLENEISSSNANSLELNALLETVKEFLRNVFPDFNGDRFTEIVDENCNQAKEEFRLYIAKKNDSFNNLFELKSKMDDDLLDLLLALKVDHIPDGIKKVEKLYLKNSKMKKIIQELKIVHKKKAETCENETKTVKQTLTTKNSLIDELTNKIGLLNDLLAKSEAKNKDLEEKVSELKSKLHSKIQQANEFIQTLRTKLTTLNKEHQTLQNEFNIINEKLNESEKSIEDLHDVINDLTKKKEELKSQNHELALTIEEQNKKYKQTIDELKNKHKEEITQKLKENQEQIENLNKEFNEKFENQTIEFNNNLAQQCQQYKEKVREIKKQAKERYDEMLNQMKKQNAECREMISNLTHEKMNLVDQNERCEKTITELTLKIQKAESKSAATIADYDRERKSQISKTTAQIMSLKNEYQSTIEQLQNQLTKIGDFIRNEFKSFFDESTEVYEKRGIEDILIIIHQKLDSATL